ncbi:hypothetical protein R8Z50_09140 [Longispora sp. K20-0274]|uniref:hypothetical protein n=1 Tax=Longispora sp. K20-0274 TaxID=3088255 RepID=UPI00399A9FB9
MSGAHRQQGDDTDPLADGSVPAEDDARLRRPDDDTLEGLDVEHGAEVSAEDIRVDAEARAATLFPHRPM